MIFLGACAVSACTAAQVAPPVLAAAGAARPAAAPGQRPAARAAGFSAEVLYKLLVAEFATRRGKYAIAIDDYLSAARSARDARVAELAVRVAVFAHDERRGIAAARLWSRLAPGSRQARQVLGVLLMRSGEITPAIHVFRGLIAQYANPAKGFAAVGSILGQERDKTGAVAIMEHLVAGHERLPGARLALARLLARAGQAERAAAELSSLLKQRPRDPKVVIFYAHVLQQQGAMAHALRVLSTYLDARANRYEVRLVYARMLIEAKRYAAARDQFGLLARAKPEDPEVGYALALLDLQTHQVEAAEAQFRFLAAHGMRPNAAHFYLGQIAESRKQYAKAIDQYRQVYDGEHYFGAQLRIAVMLAAEKKVRDALEFLQNVTSSNEMEAVELVRTRAELLIGDHQLKRAMEAYDEGLSDYPNDTDLLYARAMLAEKLGRLDILERDLRTVIARDPNNAEALNALGFTLADRTNRYQEAYSLIKRALALKPDNYYILDSMGWVLYRLGRLKEAIGYLRHALRVKADPEVAAHLGEVLWADGQQAQARAVWDAAQRTAPGDKHLRQVIEKFVH